MGDGLTIRRPDDWHLHLRSGEMMDLVLPATARHFGRAIVMPNLVPPVARVEQAEAYRQRILDTLPGDSAFQPLMTLYLTGQTSPEEIRRAASSAAVTGVKLYPSGATTHSEAGVSHIERSYPVFETMAEVGLPLLVHGEVTDPGTDVFDREARFIEETLAPLVETIVDLRVVLEHVSTRVGVEFVRSKAANLAATITPHHLYMNRNALFSGGLRPHNYCLPLLKREADREALVAAATSGDSRFFIGTDSAPHLRSGKESACGCAGTFNAPVALAVYAEIFDSAQALEQLEAFTSINGPRFYGLPVNTDSVTLLRKPWRVPDAWGSDPDPLIPWLAGETLSWQVADA